MLLLGACLPTAVPAWCAGGENLTLFGTNSSAVQQDGGFAMEVVTSVPPALVAAAKQRTVAVDGSLVMETATL